MLNELVHFRQWSDTLIPRWPTVGRVVYTVVRLVTLDCTCGLSTRYPTADSVVSTSASVEESVSAVLVSLFSAFN